jgi:predicted nuclease of predicted toxin-antitoxin system
MLRLLADHNVDEHIVRGLAARLPALDCVLARDVEMAQATDPELLDWAASHGRILVSFDKRTLPDFAYAHIATGPIPGVLIIRAGTTYRAAIDMLELIILASVAAEWEDKVTFIP